MVKTGLGFRIKLRCRLYRVYGSYNDTTFDLALLGCFFGKTELWFRIKLRFRMNLRLRTNFCPKLHGVAATRGRRFVVHFLILPSAS